MLPFIILALGFVVLMSLRNDGTTSTPTPKNGSGGVVPPPEKKNDLMTTVGAAASIIPAVAAAGKAIAGIGAGGGGSAAIAAGGGSASGGAAGGGAGAKTGSAIATGVVSGLSTGFALYLGVAAVIVIALIITSEIFAANIAYNNRFAVLADIRRIMIQMHLMEAELLTRLANEYRVNITRTEIKDPSLNYNWLAGTQRMTTQGYRPVIKVNETAIEKASLSFGSGLTTSQQQGPKYSMNDVSFAAIENYKQVAKVLSYINRTYWLGYAHQAFAINLSVRSQLGGKFEEYDASSKFLDSYDFDREYFSLDAFMYSRPYANENFGEVPNFVLPWESVFTLTRNGAFRAFCDAARLAQYDTTIWLEGDKLGFAGWYLNKLGFPNGASQFFRIEKKLNRTQFIALKEYWKIDREVEFDIWEIRVGMPGVKVL